MADNFNLRSFLTENKLTKNAKLLKEGSDYGYEAVIDAIADHFQEGTPEYDQVLAAVENAFHNNEVDTLDFSHDPSAPGKVVLNIAAGLGLAEEKKTDNFNLRSFLTENKLTKNAKLLKEEQEDYKYFDEEGNGGFYLDTVDGHKIYSMEDSSVMDTCFYAIVSPDGNEEFVGIDVAGEPISSEELQNKYELQSNIADFIEADINAELGDGLDENKLDEANYSDSYNTPAAKAVNAKAGQIVGSIRGYKTALETIQDAIKQVEQEVGSEVTSSEKSTLEKHLLWMFRREMEMERESVDNKKPVMETLTAKERRLVEMVQDALGMAPQAVAEEAPIADDEMVQENPLPKYKNIDELMSSIEHGTNEAAHKYKMDRMKEVAEALEAKVSSLEEGENAEHIDQKAVKQMRKDILALRKGEEKLRKEFEKKFANKKEKKEDK